MNRIIPITLPIPRPSPMNEYVKDMTAATIESHHNSWKSGIWEKIISETPYEIMYQLLFILHGFFPPLL